MGCNSSTPVGTGSATAGVLCSRLEVDKKDVDKLKTVLSRITKGRCRNSCEEKCCWNMADASEQIRGWVENI